MEKVAAAPKPYKSASKLATALLILSVCIMVVNCAEICTFIGGIIIASLADANSTAASADDTVFDSLAALIGGCEVLLIVVSNFTFMIWFIRIRQNIDAMGVTGLKSTISDCINAFFIPFENLYKPYKNMQEIWKASAPSALTEQWTSAKGSKLISWWWLFSIGGFILGSLCNVGAKSLEVNSPNADIALILFGVYIFAEVTSLVAALLELLLVRKLTERQEAQHQVWLGNRPEGKGADYVQPRVVS